MSTTRAGDRPGRSHVPPTPPAKLAPADDPAWAPTLMLAALAREARSTTTNEETTTMYADGCIRRQTWDDDGNETETWHP